MSEEAKKVETLEPKALATKMGISAKRLRMFLREHFPREADQRGKKWEITREKAREIQEAYKRVAGEREKAKKDKIDKELKGEPKGEKGTPKKGGIHKDYAVKS